MKELTDRQQEAFSYVEASIKEQGYPPTIREVAARLDITVRAAYDHLKALEKKGYLAFGENRSRAMAISPRDDSGNAGGSGARTVAAETEPPCDGIDRDDAAIPLYGEVAAGNPIIAESNIEKYIGVPSTMSRHPETFALRVRGDSMRDAGIMNGDIAIVEPAQTARDSQIVVAMLGEEATIKRYFRESNRIRLQPENPDYQPIYTQDARVIGLLRGIIRTIQ